MPFQPLPFFFPNATGAAVRFFPLYATAPHLCGPFFFFSPYPTFETSSSPDPRNRVGFAGLSSPATSDCGLRFLSGLVMAFLFLLEYLDDFSFFFPSPVAPPGCVSLFLSRCRQVSLGGGIDSDAPAPFFSLNPNQNTNTSSPKWRGVAHFFFLFSGNKVLFLFFPVGFYRPPFSFHSDARSCISVPVLLF